MSDADKKTLEDDQKRFKEIDELNDLLQSSKRNKVAIENKIRQTTIFKRKSELTSLELKQMDQKLVTYKAIGRMFVRTPIETIRQQLEDKIVNSATDLEALKKDAYLEKDIISKERALGELQAEHIRIMRTRREKKFQNQNHLYLNKTFYLFFFFFNFYLI